MSEFKICDRVEAHSNDVKGIYNDGLNENIITVSRDLSTRLWIKNDGKYMMHKKIELHKSFISCVTYVNGFILSGGYDNFINCYQPDKSDVVFQLKGHTENVTSIAVQNDNIISSSMDQTVIFWDLENKIQKSVFKGHTLGIWKVIFLESSRSSILTASADKTIIQWNFETQEIIRRYIGHTDCVRSLVEIVGQNKFLSCSNDGTARIWSLENTNCLKIFLDNSSDNVAFLYDLCLLKNVANEKMKFVTCGEFGVLSIWDLDNNNKPLQKIKVPNCNDIWCIKTLPNNDFVVGCDDGMIRVYTQDKNRHAECIEVAEKLKTEEETNDTLEVYEKLPKNNIESLCFPGTSNGELKKVLDEGTEIIYEWSMELETWKHKVNLTQLRQSNAPANAPGEPKTTTFSIDVKDNSPPIKLHYRSDEDPWVVAQKFISDNDVSQGYLEQIVDFINKNANKKPQSQQKPNNTYESGVSDPFTGGSRYIPSFDDVNTKPTSSTSGILKKYRTFPVIKKTHLTAVNVNGLLKKIGEFEIQIPDNIRDLLENIDDISSIKAINAKKCAPIAVLEWTIQWINQTSDDKLFPLLDVVRLLIIQNEDCSKLFFSYKTKDADDLLVNIFDRIVEPNSTAKNHRGNILNLVRLMINSYRFTTGQIFMLNYSQRFSTHLTKVAMDSNDNSLLTAISQWYLNQACLLNDRDRDPSNLSESTRKKLTEERQIVFQVCIDFSSHVQTLENILTDQNAITNALLCLGTLICGEDKFVIRDSFQKQGPTVVAVAKKSCRDTDGQLDRICRDLIELGETIDMSN